jgi:signal transduction histidine kinase
MKESILIVDHDPRSRTFLKAVLERGGYPCLTAPSGSEALEWLGREPIALVLSDLTTPGMDSLDLLRQVKARDETVAIILMSALETTEWMLTALREGVTDYLLKPVEREAVIASVERAFHARVLQREKRLRQEHLEATVEQLTRQVKDLQEKVTRTHRQTEEPHLSRLPTKRLSEVGLMASTLIHDIVNPLTVILGEAQMLALRQADNPAVQQSCLLIQQYGERITQLIQSVKTYIGRQREEQQPVMLHQVIDDSLTLVRKSLTTNNITITRRYALTSPVVFGHAHQLEQVFINLFQNAFQAMPDSGALTIETRLLHDEASGTPENVEVSVTDTGNGIPEEHLPSIFNAFFTTKSDGQGMGLGLAICKRIVEDHRGRIIPESRNGQGTRMIVILPLTQ